MVHTTDFPLPAESEATLGAGGILGFRPACSGNKCASTVQ